MSQYMYASEVISCVFQPLRILRCWRWRWEEFLDPMMLEHFTAPIRNEFSSLLTLVNSTFSLLFGYHILM